MTVGTVLPGYIAQHETDAAAEPDPQAQGVAGSLSLTDVARISAELNEAIEQGRHQPAYRALPRGPGAGTTLHRYLCRARAGAVSPAGPGEAREVCLHALHQALVSEDLDLIEPALSQARSHCLASW